MVAPQVRIVPQQPKAGDLGGVLVEVADGCGIRARMAKDDQHRRIPASCHPFEREERGNLLDDDPGAASKPRPIGDERVAGAPPEVATERGSKRQFEEGVPVAGAQVAAPDRLGQCRRQSVRARMAGLPVIEGCPMLGR